MLLLGALLLVVSVICVEREYFNIPGPSTWEDARQHCQACYKDLTTITPANAEVISLKITSDHWIGLRQNMSGSKFWSRWANGDPVLYQNWYPGHPVLKKKSQPTCPPAPADVMQCPAFTKLCTCLNSTGDIDDFLFWEDSAMFNSSITNTSMWCPAFAKLCDCLNSTKENKTSVAEFTNPALAVSPSTCTKSPTNATSSDLEPKYIEDSCVVLLSFGMWQEKQCNTSLPYVCYDERFYGEVEISNETQTEAFLRWSEAGINIFMYRIEINGKQIENSSVGTSYQITSLDPGELYKVQVIPVRCGRDLNAQNISFYTLPEEIQNLSKVSVETDVINLSWEESRGTNISYLVNTQPGNLNSICYHKYCSITKLQPGQMYTFTVKAVVNKTSFGTPGSIHACTKPSKPMNLTSSNNDSFTITATWDSPDTNSMQYTYKVTLDNLVYNCSSKTITLTNVTSGSKYTLTVSAIVPDCFEAGEPASISAFTLPMAVTNLQLSSDADSITATWEISKGSFSWFNLTISSLMSENITCPSITTTNLTYTFKSLRAAALYTVSIITYVEKDLNPSEAVNESFYTKPVSPGEATVKTLNNTALQLSWKVPLNSQGVKNINYSVKYVSDFWNANGNLSLIGITSVIIGGLQSGTKYKFNITVLAGNLESHPSVTSGLTEPINRVLTIGLLCSSSTLLYCINNSIENDALVEMHNFIQDKFGDNIFWNLTLRERNKYI